MNSNDLVAEKINAILKEYDYEPLEMLSSHVARLCNVTEEELRGSRDRTYKSQARWLLWYAYRYMTGESYAMIAMRYGGGFHTRTVASGIVKMTHLIGSDELWRNRWNVLRHVIKSSRTQEEDTNIIITVQVPKGMGDKVKLEIKEK